MMYEWLGSLLFRCINFSIIIWLFIYVIMHYIMPRILVKKQAYMNEHVVLSEKQHAIMQKKQEAQEVLEYDQKICAILKRKVLVWKTRVVQEQADHIQAEAIYIDKMQERATQQAQARADMRIMREVIPAILQNAHMVLQEQYAHQAAGKKYIKQVLRMMKDHA